MESRKRRIEGSKDIEFPLPETRNKLPEDYPDFIIKIKNRIESSRLKLISLANEHLIILYWEIGQSILEQQKEKGWGSKVIDRMAYDIKTTYPELNGFSPRNLKYMRKFAEVWPNKEFVQRCVAQIPWRTNITLIDKFKDNALRAWYAQKVIEQGYSKEMLVVQIENELHKHVGNIPNNFKNTLLDSHAELAKQTFKDPYIFDFLGTDFPRKENELEQKLIDHIQKFLIELGQGFAFVGRQVHVEIGDADFYIDLLFYHLKLRCFVVIELKSGEFKAEFVSKLNLYQNIVNNTYKHSTDQPTIGLLLVKSKNATLVEYSLMGNSNTMGIANWETKLIKELPDELKADLPSIQDIESELNQNNLFDD